jgi:hypothetical protein
MPGHFDFYLLFLDAFKFVLLAFLCASLLFVALGWSEEIQRWRDSRMRSRRTRRRAIPLSQLGYRHR